MSIRESRTVIIIAVAFVTVYQSLLSFVPAFGGLVDDEKGISGMLLVGPLTCLVACLIEAARHGFGLARPVLLAAAVSIMLTALVGALTEITTVLLYFGFFFVFGLVGELIGWPIHSLRGRGGRSRTTAS